MKTVFDQNYSLLLLALVTFSCRMPSLQKESRVSDAKGAEQIKVGLFEGKKILVGSAEAFTSINYCLGANEEAFNVKCKVDAKDAFAAATVVRKAKAPGAATIYSTDTAPAENMKVHIRGIKADGSTIERIFSLKSSSTAQEDPNKTISDCKAYSAYLFDEYPKQRREKKLPEVKVNEALCNAAKGQSDFLAKIKFRPSVGKSPHTENTTSVERAILAGYKGTNADRELYLGIIPDGPDSGKQLVAWVATEEFKNIMLAADIDEVGFALSVEVLPKGKNLHVIATFGKAP